MSKVTKEFRSITGWILIKENPVPVTHRSSIMLGGTSSLEVTDFQSFLGLYDTHPYTGVVVASGVPECPIGATVAFNAVANMNKSAYAKYNGEVLKLLRMSDIMYYEIEIVTEE